MDRALWKQFTGKGNNWLFESDVFGQISLPTTSLKTLLFTPLIDDSQKNIMEETLSENGNSDALIVVRATGEFSSSRWDDS